jgi:hypothetical protein
MGNPLLMPILDRKTREPSPLTRISLRRSSYLSGTGAMVGLILAGYALFTARGTSTLFVPPEDVALVNQQPLSRTDFLALLQTLYGVDLKHSTPLQRKTALDGMIREELFVQRGKELDLASSDPDVRSALVNAVEAEIAEDAVTSRPSEAALRKYFDARSAHYSNEGIMTVRDILFSAADQTAVARAVEVFRTAAPVPALVERLHGKLSSRVGDEEFYFAARIHLGDQLFDIARELTDGGVSAPVPAADGIHVLYMLKNIKPVPFTFAEAHDRVLNDYRNDAIARLRTGDESFLWKRANILIAEDLR